MIIRAIAHHPDVEEALVFGSRAMGNYKPGSDVDIALKGKLDAETRSDIFVELNEYLPLLYKFDVVEYSSIVGQPLMETIDRHGKLLYQRKPKRTGASVNVYLVLREKDRVLLSLRKNTGYLDGFYGLVAGHVEDGESATAAMIREAREEAGIELTAAQLKVVHMLHRQTNRFNVDVFFECTSWQGKIENREPEKCEKLEFFPIEQLPSNLMDYVGGVLDAVSRGMFYSELGWSSDGKTTNV